MRPQRNAGENQVRSEIASKQATGFNEAPAKCRGKHHGVEPAGAIEDGLQ